MTEVMQEFFPSIGQTFCPFKYVNEVFAGHDKGEARSITSSRERELCRRPMEMHGHLPPCPIFSLQLFIYNDLNLYNFPTRI